MLPSLPKSRPVARRVTSSCDTSFLLDDKVSVVDVPSPTISRVEIYEHKDDLWAEMEDLETESKYNLQEADAKSSNYRDQDE